MGQCSPPSGHELYRLSVQLLRSLNIPVASLEVLRVSGLGTLPLSASCKSAGNWGSSSSPTPQTVKLLIIGDWAFQDSLEGRLPGHLSGARQTQLAGLLKDEDERALWVYGWLLWVPWFLSFLDVWIGCGRVAWTGEAAFPFWGDHRWKMGSHPTSRHSYPQRVFGQPDLNHVFHSRMKKTMKRYQ